MRLAAWGALAEIGAWINLFNLTPIWQLDGAHGFKGLLVLLLIGATIAAMSHDAPEQPDRRTLLEFLVLIGALTALASLHVPVAALSDRY